jgi:hypothetical protein
MKSKNHTSFPFSHSDGGTHPSVVIPHYVSYKPID